MEEIQRLITSGEEILDEAVRFSVAQGIVPVALVFVAIFVFSRPLKFIIKLLINTVLGFAALFAVNYFAPQLGVIIGINWFTGIVVAVFGIPGVAALFAVQWFMLL